MQLRNRVIEAVNTVLDFGLGDDVLADAVNAHAGLMAGRCLD